MNLEEKVEWETRAVCAGTVVLGCSDCWINQRTRPSLWHICLFKKLLPQLSCCFISIPSPCAMGISVLDLQGWWHVQLHYHVSNNFISITWQVYQLNIWQVFFRHSFEHCSPTTIFSVWFRILDLDLVVRDEDGNILDPEQTSTISLFRAHEIASKQVEERLQEEKVRDSVAFSLWNTRL